MATQAKGRKSIVLAPIYSHFVTNDVELTVLYKTGALKWPPNFYKISGWGC